MTNPHNTQTFTHLSFFSVATFLLSPLSTHQREADMQNNMYLYTQNPECITGHTEIPTALDALRMGASVVKAEVTCLSEILTIKDRQLITAMCAWALAVYSPKDYGITAGSICCGFLWKSEITPTLLKNPLSHPAHTSKPSRLTLVIGLLWRESRFLCIFHTQMLKYEQLFATETMTLTDDQRKHSTVPACSTEQAPAPFLGCIQQHLFPLPALNK